MMPEHTSSSGNDVASYWKSIEQLATVAEKAANLRSENERALEAQLRSASAGYEQPVSFLDTLITNVQAARNSVEHDGSSLNVSPSRPVGLAPDASVQDILDSLPAIEQQIYSLTAMLPRLRLRKRGLRMDLFLIPIAAVTVFIGIVSTLINGGNIGISLLAAILLGGVASLIVVAAGGGWTFRRLGGQDYIPRVASHNTGRGGIPAFRAVAGVIVLIHGIAYIQDGGTFELILAIISLSSLVIRLGAVASVEPQRTR